MIETTKYYGRMKDIQRQYDCWVQKVCQYLAKVGPLLGGEEGTHCATFQSKPILDHHPDVVFLGYNPHEEWGFFEEDAQPTRFYEGNPSFYEKEKGQYKRDKWPVWRPLVNAFKWARCERFVEDGNFIFFNAVYFGSRNISNFEKLEGSKSAVNQCLDFTAEVILDIFHPKCIICLSVNKCFDLLNQKFHFELIKKIDTAAETNHLLLDFALNRTDQKNWKNIFSCSKSIKKGIWNGIPIYGIPHPSSRVSGDDWGAIALYLRSELENQ